jgi:hypothetical protein
MKKTALLAMILMVVSVFSVNAADDTKKAPAKKATAKKATATKVTVSSLGKPVFDFQLSAGWTSKPYKKELILIPPAKYPHIQLWHIEKAKDIATAEKNIAQTITSEVIKFKVKESKEVKIAGNSAKKLIGSGLEADDQDPSNAVVYLFTVNSKVFVLCIHGEGDEASKYADPMLKMLETIKPVK